MARILPSLPREPNAPVDDDAVRASERRFDVVVLDVRGFQPADVDLAVVVDAAVPQRFRDRDIGVAVLGVLADDRQRDLVRRAA